MRIVGLFCTFCNSISTDIQYCTRRCAELILKSHMRRRLPIFMPFLTLTSYFFRCATHPGTETRNPVYCIWHTTSSICAHIWLQDFYTACIQTYLLKIYFEDFTCSSCCVQNQIFFSAYTYWLQTKLLPLSSRRALCSILLSYQNKE